MGLKKVNNSVLEMFVIYITYIIYILLLAKRDSVTHDKL